MSGDPMFGPFFWGVIAGSLSDVILKDISGWKRFLISGAIYIAASTASSQFFWVARL